MKRRSEKLVKRIPEKDRAPRGSGIMPEPEKTKKIIMEIIPAEAGAQEFIFDPPRSMVIIHADKPGLRSENKAKHLRN